MATKLIIKKLGLLLTTIGLVANLQAAGSSETLSANIRSDNKISLQAGAKTYMNYCLACHSMKYMRYEVLVDGLDIPAEIVEKNLMFTGGKISDHITNNVSENDAQDWFGKAPPVGAHCFRLIFGCPRRRRLSRRGRATPALAFG